MSAKLTDDAGDTYTLSRLRRLSIPVIAGALAALGPLSIDMYLPALPSLTKDLHASASLAQLSLTACLLGLSLGQLLAGPQSDIRGRRIPLLIGLLGYALSSLLAAFSPSIWALILLRFIQGLAGSTGLVISLAIVRDLFSGSEMTRFFALLLLINGAGPVVAPVAGAQLLQITSWRGVFIALSLAGIFMFVAVLFGLPETLPVQRRSKAGIVHTLSTFRVLLSDRAFIGFALPQGLVMAAMFAYISGSPFVIQNIFGASPQLFSLFFATNALGIIVAGQITGRLAGKIKETKLFVTGIGIASIGGISLLVAILSGAGLTAILPPLFLVVSSVGIVSTAGSSLAMQNYGHSAGSASALLGLLSLGFGAIVAPLVGLGGSYTATPMGVVIAVAEIGAVLCYAIPRRRS
ncbi:MAG TPA: multidrug effflux MFS transporter [Spirochaetia bacterium]|nr:multidrug effflux MFS transporter [Spirochaetia bacterium]